MNKLNEIVDKYQVSFWKNDDEFAQDIISYATEVAQNSLKEASKKAVLSIKRNDFSIRNSKSRIDTIQGLWGTYNETTTVDSKSIINSENIKIL